MKFTNEVEINQPLNKVIELFDNPDNMSKWQPGFVSFEHLSGEQGQPGAKSKLKYKMGKREVEMIETITVRNLPKEFHGTYEANGVHHEMQNYFTEVAQGRTKWVSENEFKLSGMLKLVGWLMPGAFKKQSQKYLNRFKSFAENSN
jgi:carbon monoxide dehydrogenase subunit G